MPHRVGPARSVIYNKKVLLSVFGGLVALLVMAIATIFLYSRPITLPAAQARLAAGKPLCADQTTFRPDFEIAPEIEVKLSPDCWSGWMAIPNQTTFRISSPDGVEILTPRGEWLRFGPDEARWLGEVRFSTFRLSGEGQAVVFVERR